MWWSQGKYLLARVATSISIGIWNAQSGRYRGEFSGCLIGVDRFTVCRMMNNSLRDATAMRSSNGTWQAPLIASKSWNARSQFSRSLWLHLQGVMKLWKGVLHSSRSIQLVVMYFVV
jgi:hypothetical protein